MSQIFLILLHFFRYIYISIHYLITEIIEILGKNREIVKPGETYDDGKTPYTQKDSDLIHSLNRIQFIKFICFWLSLFILYCSVMSLVLKYFGYITFTSIIILHIIILLLDY